MGVARGGGGGDGADGSLSSRVSFSSLKFIRLHGLPKFGMSN